MQLYLAGSTSPKKLEAWASNAPLYAPIILRKDDDPLDDWHLTPNFLFTFAHADAQKCAEHFCERPCAYDFCEQPHRRIFIDSGAFTAWKKGIKLDEKYLSKYMEFCRKIQKRAKCCVTFAAVDIPLGKEGDKPETITLAQKEKACEQGWEYYQTMRKNGIPCLPVFHQLEHVKWLRRIADNSDYFAVSPRKDISAAKRHRWLKSVFDYIGPSKKKIHGFGISSDAWLREFPFFSVDRTDWLWAIKLERYPLPNRRQRSLDEWTELLYHDGEDWEALRERLREILAYGTYGVKPDPQGRRGKYWFATLAIARELSWQREITKFWRQKGVVWDGETNREAVPS